LLDAAWEEFTQNKFSDVSINRIIQQAHIPRGSFYQYFEDKEELFSFMVHEIQAYFHQVVVESMDEAGGDPFRFPVGVYDRLLAHSSLPDATLERWLKLIKMNPGWDFKRQSTDLSDCDWGELASRVRTDCLREQNPDYAAQVFAILFALTGSAVATAVAQPERREEQRALLQRRVDIVRTGSGLTE
jgi:AcrR family transcriptional regulator